MEGVGSGGDMRYCVGGTGGVYQYEMTHIYVDICIAQSCRSRCTDHCNRGMSSAWSLISTFSEMVSLFDSYNQRRSTK